MDDEEAFYILHQVEETIEIDSEYFYSVDRQTFEIYVQLWANIRAAETEHGLREPSPKMIRKLFKVKEEVREIMEE